MDIEVVIDSQQGTRRVERISAVAPISIGRSPTCSLYLDSDRVSRKHVIISVVGNALQVEDTSTNGTLAGQQLLRRTSAIVPFGTPVTIGEFTLYLQPIGAPPAHPPVPIMASGPGITCPSGAGADWTVPPHVAHSPMVSGAGASGAQFGHPVPPVHAGQFPAPQVPAHMPSRPLPRAAISSPAQVIGAPMAKIKPVPVPLSTSSPIAKLAETDKVKVAMLRREIHKQLLEHLDLAALDVSKLDDPSMRPKVLNALRKIVQAHSSKIPPGLTQDQLVGELADEALGLGPLEEFLEDPSVSEIMVVDPHTIYVERGGKLEFTGAGFTDDERVRAVIERIVTPLGRRIDESSPLVDARLKDGSRVNAVIRPIALRGSCITIRKFAKVPLTLEKLISFGALSEQMGRFLQRCVIAKRNVVISGGTGSGKTTLLNVLSAAIPERERIVTIEDAAELQLEQPHVVSLETRPPNMEGKGEYTIRDLVKNALRMRPDRIVVGECRGGEALDMLQAMNTGHDGSLTTTHANSPAEALGRLETLALMAGIDLPVKAIRDQIAASIHIVVQQSRFSDGSRKVTTISEILGLDDDGFIELVPIFEFERTGTGPDGKVVGHFRSSGYLPSFLDQFIVLGLIKPGEPYL